MFEALAAYARMGDRPEDWQKFRLMYPDFFPSSSSQFKWPGFRDLTEWMYTFAEAWSKDYADLPPERRPLPPLLWYRNRLRAVWSRNDQHGYNLAILYGLEREAKRIAKEHPGEVNYDMLVSPALIPGPSVAAALSQLALSQFGQADTSGGLPPGRPVINGVSGEIIWEFGCAMQEAVYALMQHRWRAMICPKCGRYFIADKTAQKVCRVRCAEEIKRERALNYWNEKGRKRRAKKARIN